MKIAFLLMCVLLLNACTNSFLTDELASNSSDFDVSYKTQSGNQNYIIITDSMADSYKISYQLGANPPDDCSNSAVSASDPGEVLIPSLTGGQRYSFRVCRSNGQSKTFSFVPGNLVIEDNYTNTSNLWNIWLKKSDDTLACDNTVTYMDECFHASEVKKVVTLNFESCSDLEMNDENDFFDWTCSVENQKAVFTSKLKDATKFKNMIDPGSFKPNKVSLSYKSQVVNESTLSSWWSNSFIEITGAVAFTGTLDNTIYYVAENVDFQNTVTINGSNSVLVTLNGAEISGTASGDNSIELGNLAQMNWIEVNLQSLGTSDGMRVGGKLHYIRYSTISGASDDCVFIPGTTDRLNLIVHSEISNCNYGIYMSGAHSNIVRDSLFKNIAVSGFELNNSHVNKFINLKFLQSGQAYRFVGSPSNANYIHKSIIADSSSGVAMANASQRNIFYNLKIYNSNDDGISVTSDGEGNRFINAYIIGGRKNGIRINGATNGLKFTNVVSAFNRESGVSVRASENIDLVNVSSFRNGSLAGTGGFLFSDTNKVTCTNCLSTLNNNSGFIIGESSLDSLNNAFHGNLIVGNNGGTQCEVVTSADVSHGIIDGTCTASGTNGSSDFSNGASTATYYNSTDITSAFVGTASVDSVNEHGSISLPISFDSISDWFQFDNYQRFWVNEGATLIVDANNTECSSGSNCDIWDMTLNKTSSNQLFNTSFNFADGNPEPVGTNCPSAIAGSEYIDSQALENYTSLEYTNNIEIIGDSVGDDDGVCEITENCINRYLKHAYEIVSDEVGDNDGLCEANESCIYSPNWAEAYTPDNLTQCTYSANGGLANIEMWVPDIN